MRDTISMNSRVAVTLTSVGKSLIQTHYDDVGLPVPAAMQGDVIELSVWKMAQLFGNHLFKANPRPPIEERLRIVEWV